MKAVRKTIGLLMIGTFFVGIGFGMSNAFGWKGSLLILGMVTLFFVGGILINWDKS